LQEQASRERADGLEARCTETTAQARLLLSEAYDALALREAAVEDRIAESQQYLQQSDQHVQDVESRLVAALEGRRRDAEEAAALAEELHSAQACIRELQQQLESARMANVQLELQLADQLAALAGAAGCADASTQDAPADDVLADIVLQSEVPHTANVQRLMSVEQALAEAQEQREEAHHSKSLLLQINQEAASRAAKEEQQHEDIFCLFKATEDAKQHMAQLTAELMRWSSDVSSASSSSASSMGSSQASADNAPDFSALAPAPASFQAAAASSAEIPMAQQLQPSCLPHVARSSDDTEAGDVRVRQYEMKLMKRVAPRSAPRVPGSAVTCHSTPAR
jgi:hypothetical protein